jgi:glycosyltransferase involved in cell wall biosynthesis
MAGAPAMAGASDDASAPLTVGLLGGAPPALGGGGLELQLERTREALTGLGHDAFHVEREARPFDLLHAFGAEADVWHALRHWRRSRGPLVLSPVLVVPTAAERRLRLWSRVPVADFGPRMKAELLARADALVALTQHEAALLRRLAQPRCPPVTVIGNGVDPVDQAEPPQPLPERFVLLLGTVSTRKRQAETVAALGGGAYRVVAVGGFEGSEEELDRWRRSIGAAGVWLGEVRDAAVVRSVVRRAAALVHLSEAEGQSLAVLEALAEGTPAILSPLPSNRELARRFPGHVRLVERPQDLAAALASLPPDLGPAPVPSWRAVAEQLVELYRAVLRASPGDSRARSAGPASARR